MTEKSDFSNTDVYRMAMETSIDIFSIYDALGLPLDSTSQRIQDQVASAVFMSEEWYQAVNEKLRYSNEMGAKFMGTVSPVDPDSEEGKRVRDKLTLGEGMRADQLVSIVVAKDRVKTGIPWGTEAGADQVRREAENANSVEELLGLHRMIPIFCDERQIVIRELATRFFQKPAA